MQPFWPDDNRSSFPAFTSLLKEEFVQFLVDLNGYHVGHALHHAREEIGSSDEISNKVIGRPAVNLKRRTDLLDSSLVHDHDTITYRHRLILVMRHIDAGNSKLLLDSPDFGAHLVPEFRIKVGKRFIKEQTRAW